MHAAWREHGPDVIDRLIAEQPEVFLQAMLKIAQVHRVEVGQPEAFDRPRTREEALLRLEESAGPEAQKLFESFLKKVDKLERDQDFSEAARGSGTFDGQQLCGVPDRAKGGYRN